MYSCLYYLSQCGGLTASELCERCEEDKAAVSRSLDYLEKNGYVTCAEGSRRYRSPLGLTEKGAAVCRVLNEKIERVVEAASAGTQRPGAANHVRRYGGYQRPFGRDRGKIEKRGGGA